MSFVGFVGVRLLTGEVVKVANADPPARRQQPKNGHSLGRISPSYTLFTGPPPGKLPVLR